jgi:hypothetical protein
MLFRYMMPARTIRSTFPLGAVAQLGERLVRNEEVSGSIPLSSTKRSIIYDRQNDTFVLFRLSFPFAVLYLPGGCANSAEHFF